jgi:hypothetical protein
VAGFGRHVFVDAVEDLVAGGLGGEEAGKENDNGEEINWFSFLFII